MRLIHAVYLALSLSIGANAVAAVTGGAVPGEFAVAANGAATYRMPIDVPPGINGLQPNLAITYDSNRRNGQLGLGWGLDGLSAISRCPQNIRIHGSRGGVSFGSTDALCLNGQPLLQIAETGSGTARKRDYRTGVESWARIVGFGEIVNADGSTVPEYFVVWTKDKKILRFGDARVAGAFDQSHFVVKTRAVNSTVRDDVFAWSLRRVSDTFGNQMTFSYETNGTSGEQIVTRIDYGSVSGRTHSPYVEFVFDTGRGDTSIQYIGGAAITTSRRLTHVRTYLGTSVVRDYVLTYVQDSFVVGNAALPNNVSRLDKVYLCSAVVTGDPVAQASPCLSPTVFGWTASATGFAAAGSVSGVNFETAVLGGGDRTSRIADIDGDGIPEILRTALSNQMATYLKVYKRGADGSYALSLDNAGLFSSVQQGVVVAQGGVNELVDVDGDGDLELAIFDSGNDEFTGFVRFTGMKGARLDSNPAGVFAAGYSGQSEYANNSFALTGVSPIQIQAEGNTVTVSNSAYNSFRALNQLVDMDGDGLVDLVVVKKDVSTSRSDIVVRYGDGSGRFAVSPQTGITNAPVQVVAYSLYGATSKWGFHDNLAIVDVNGDRVMDLVSRPGGVSSNSVQVIFGMPGHVFSPTDSVTGYVEAADPSVTQQWYQTYGGYLDFNNQFVDLNGDGAPEIVSARNATQTCSNPTLTGVARSVFTGGFGVQTNTGKGFNALALGLDGIAPAATNQCELDRFQGGFFTPGDSEGVWHQLDENCRVYAERSGANGQANCTNNDVYVCEGSKFVWKSLYLAQRYYNASGWDGNTLLKDMGFCARYEVIKGTPPNTPWRSDFPAGAAGDAAYQQALVQYEIDRTTWMKGWTEGSPQVPGVPLPIVWRNALTSTLAANAGLTHDLQFADINGDGYADIVRRQPGDSGRIEILFGKGNGQFTAAWDTGIVAAGSAYSMRSWNKIVDLDGDGVVDIVTIEPMTGALTFYKSQFSGLGRIDNIVDGLGKVVAIKSHIEDKDGNIVVISGYSTAPDVVTDESTDDSPLAPLGDAISANARGVLYKVKGHEVFHKKNGKISFHFYYTHAYYYPTVDRLSGDLVFGRVDSTSGWLFENVRTYRYTDFPRRGLVSRTVKMWDNSDRAEITLTTWDYLLSKNASACGYSEKTCGKYLVGKNQESQETRTKTSSVAPGSWSSWSMRLSTTDSHSPSLGSRQYGDVASIRRADAWSTQNRLTSITPNYKTLTSLADVTAATVTGNAASSPFSGDASTRSVGQWSLVQAPTGMITDLDVTDLTTYGDKGEVVSVESTANDQASQHLRRTKSYTYTAFGSPESETDIGTDSEYTIDGGLANGAVRSRTTRYAYNFACTAPKSTASDKLCVEKTQWNNTKYDLVTKVTYDQRFGSVAAETDANKLSVDYEYDFLGRKTRDARPDGSITLTSYYDTCQLANATCPDVDTTRMVVIAVTAGGAVESLIDVVHLDAASRELRRERPGFADNAVAFNDTVYYASGKIAKTSRPYLSGSTTYWEVATYNYDRTLNVVTRPSGEKIKYEYSYGTSAIRAGWSVATRNVKVSENFGDAAKLRATTKMFNSFGQLVEETDALGGKTLYSYGQGEQPLAIVDVNGAITSFTYNRDGQITSITHPDMGSRYWRYNAFGDLKWTKDANGAVTTYSYDLLGRQTARVEPAGTTTWVYDTATNGLGKLASVATQPVGGSNGENGLAAYSETLAYDTSGRLRERKQTLAGSTVVSAWTYDGYSRVKTAALPAAGTYTPTLTYSYKRGYLESIIENGQPTAYWKVTERNSDGNVKAETFGNGVTSTRGYELATGRPTSIKTGTNNAVQNYEYGYWLDGNLDNKWDLRLGPRAIYSYDSLDRLTSSRVLIGNTQIGGFTGSYLPNDNIDRDAKLQYHAYRSARPHAATATNSAAVGTVAAAANAAGNANADAYIDNKDIPATRDNVIGTSVVAGSNADCNSDGLRNVVDIVCIARTVAAQRSGTDTTLLYDSNGNITNVGPQWITYSSFNKPMAVWPGGSAATSYFAYGPEHERVFKRVGAVAAPSTWEKSYISDYFERRRDYGGTAGSVTTTDSYRYNIWAEGRLVGVMNVNAAGTPTRSYVHTERQGSVDAITNAAGALVGAQGYTEFGIMSQNAAVTVITSRGYTGHEMDAEIDMINMNARLYMPKLQLFTSPDNLFADLENPHSLNPYSYVYNNPLRYTDPSGHLPWAEGTGDAPGAAAQAQSNPFSVDAVISNFYAASAPIPMQVGQGSVGLGFESTPAVGLGEQFFRQAAGFVVQNAISTVQLLRPDVQGIKENAENGNYGTALVLMALETPFGKEAKAAEISGKQFFEGATLHPRVLKQLESGDNHAFPALIDKIAEEYGTVVKTLDKRGGPVEMLTLKGERNGIEGTYEYIKNSANQIYHRFFNPSE